MVDSEWFGTIVDTGYFLAADPYGDIATVAPYAVNWQIKEKVDLKKVVRLNSRKNSEWRSKRQNTADESISFVDELMR